MARMSSDPCDFWGMTDNLERSWHVQSYFVVFKRRVVDSDAFRLFWKNVQAHRDKTQVILDYELGLTRALTEQGFRPGVFAAIDRWSNALTRRTRWWMKLRRRYNPTLLYPVQLLRIGMPFVKVQLLRDNVGKVPLGPVLRAMKEAGYDERRVQFVTGQLGVP
jgi:rhamnosyltransferase